LPSISNLNYIPYTEIVVLYQSSMRLPDFIEYDKKRQRIILNPRVKTEIGTYPLDIILINMINSLKR